MKKLIPSMFLKGGKAYVTRLCKVSIALDKSPVELAQCFDDNGADAIIAVVMDGKEDREETLEAISGIVENVDIPVYAACDCGDEEEFSVYSAELFARGVSRFLLLDDGQGDYRNFSVDDDSFEIDRWGILTESSDLSRFNTDFPLIVELDVSKGGNDIIDTLEKTAVMAVTGPVISSVDFPFMEAKNAIHDAGIEMNVLRPSIDLGELKYDQRGLIPVVVQDYANNQVLMLAYMNRESLEMTMATGRMTYYSRSRGELWIKGETSGHYQYVHSIEYDCDNDTLLASVRQVWAACHTGNRSCFYRNLCRREF